VTNKENLVFVHPVLSGIKKVKNYSFNVVGNKKGALFKLLFVLMLSVFKGD